MRTDETDRGTTDLGSADVVSTATVDVAMGRERARQRRIRRVGYALGGVAAVLWGRLLFGLEPVPTLGSPLPAEYMPGFLLVVVLGAATLIPLLAAGRSPHVLYRAADIDVGLADVKGAGVVVEEAVRTLNLFLGHETFRDRMGGTPRRAILFEGPPGTGKTHLAKAIAREAGVPFLYVSSSAFQSMYYGQTNRKIRSYFNELRKAARREGGAIGFIEEIDAIGAARAGMGGGGGREGVAGVVNELLIQLQSFDTPPLGVKVRRWFVDVANRFLPAHRLLPRPRGIDANVLVIGATNRAADLDPALLRPGRFDRVVHVDLPSRAGRREILDFYLARKAHEPELDEPARRDALAAMTFGYSPVQIEHLLDEGLVWAIRRGAARMSWEDVQRARLTEELGLGHPVEYAEAERRRIATHEAGHAAVAHHVGRHLEVLSIVKRRDSLGLLAHRDVEERFMRTRSECEALLRVALGGMVAEELLLGESGTGVAGDLQMATTTAAQMVGSFGMSDSLISYEAVSMGGGANVVAKVLASDAGREALEEILEQARAEVRAILTSRRPVVEALRDALLDRDELLGDEILDAIDCALPLADVVELR